MGQVCLLSQVRFEEPVRPWFEAALLLCLFADKYVHDVFSSCVTGSLLSGSALLVPFAGLLCQYGFDGGWPSVFYVFGLFNV